MSEGGRVARERKPLGSILTRRFGHEPFQSANISDWGSCIRIFASVLAIAIAFMTLVFYSEGSSLSTRQALIQGSFRGGEGPTHSIQWRGENHLLLDSDTGRFSIYSAKVGKRVWRLDTGERIHSDQYESHQLRALDFDSKTGMLLAQARDRTVGLFDPALKRRVSSFSSDFGFSHFEKLDGWLLPGGKRALLLSAPSVLDANRIKVVNLESGETIWEAFGEATYLPESGRILRSSETIGKETIIELHRVCDGQSISRIVEVANGHRPFFRYPSDKGEAIGLIAVDETNALLLNGITGDTFALSFDDPNGLSEANALAGDIYLYDVSPDGRLMAIRSRHSSVFSIRSAVDGALLLDLAAALSELRQGMSLEPDSWFSFSPNGKSFLLSDNEGIIYEWNLDTLEFVGQYGPVEDYEAVVALGLDGVTLATHKRPNGVKIWNLREQSLLAELDLPNRIYGVMHSPSVDRLAIVEQGGAVRLFAFPTGEFLGRYSSGEGLAFGSAYLNSRDRIIVYYQNGVVNEYIPATMKVDRSYRLPDNFFGVYAIDDQTGRVLARTFGNAVGLLDPSSGNYIWETDSPLQRIVSSALVTNGDMSMIAVIGLAQATDQWFTSAANQFPFRRFPNWRIKVFNTDGSETIHDIVVDVAFLGLDEPVGTPLISLQAGRLELSPDGSWIACHFWGPQGSGGPEFKSFVGVYELASGDEIFRIDNDDTIQDFLFHENGNSIFVLASEDDERALSVSEYDMDTFERRSETRVSSLVAPLGSTPGLFFGISPDRSAAAIASWSHHIALIDLASNEARASRPARKPGSSFVFRSSLIKPRIFFSGSNNQLFFQDSQGLIDNWNLMSGRLIGSAITRETAGLTLQARAKSNMLYQLERSENLRTWTPGETVSTNGDREIEFPLEWTTQGSLFWRVSEFPLGN